MLYSANTSELPSPKNDTTSWSLVNTIADKEEHPAVAAYVQAETEAGGSGVGTQNEEEEFGRQDTNL